MERLAELELPTAIPAFIEVCAVLACEAAGRGALADAERLIWKAARAIATVARRQPREREEGGERDSEGLDPE
jgi:hypothetical protein